MRIGFDAKRAFSNSTGLGNYSRFVLSEILNNKSKLEVLAYTPSIKKTLFNDFPLENVILPKFRFFGSFWRSFFIGFSFKKKNVQLFHGLSNELPFFVNSKKTKLIVTIHDLIFIRYPDLYKPLDGLIYRYKFKFACKKADTIIAISEQTKCDIVHFFEINPEKIKVVYQNCNALFYEQVEEQKRENVKSKYGLNKPYILCVGTIEKRKNQLNLLKAFEKGNFENLDLIIVGRGKEYKKELENYILKNNVKNIQILSDVKTSELPELYQSAHIFAYVSVFEGFGIPIIEALASKIPVLATKGSCLEEAGGNAAIYVDPYDIENITESLNTLNTDLELRTGLISNSEKQILKFKSSKIIKEMLDIYSTCLLS